MLIVCIPLSHQIVYRACICCLFVIIIIIIIIIIINIIIICGGHTNGAATFGLYLMLHCDLSSLCHVYLL
jgi:hypothetical protein